MPFETHPADALFLSLWSKAKGTSDYVKDEWKRLQVFVNRNCYGNADTTEDAPTVNEWDPVFVITFAEHLEPSSRQAIARTAEDMAFRGAPASEILALEGVERVEMVQDLDAVDQRIQELEDAEWKSVISADPEPGERVLVWCGLSDVQIGRFGKSRRWWNLDHKVIVDDVTHWRPLPKPPKGRQDERR